MPGCKLVEWCRILLSYPSSVASVTVLGDLIDLYFPRLSLLLLLHVFSLRALRLPPTLWHADTAQARAIAETTGPSIQRNNLTQRSKPALCRPDAEPVSVHPPDSLRRHPRNFRTNPGYCPPVCFVSRELPPHLPSPPSPAQHRK